MDKILIAIGGGEIKSKETLEIDRYIASLAKKRAKDKRAYALFLGTASHDSMPYFNSFRKTYTSEFDIKADVALICYKEMSLDKIKGKIEKADMIYVGGGDTVFMLNTWEELGITDLLLKAYENGTIICGLSAGAICWFKKMYSDSKSTTNDEQYNVYNGLGWIDGLICPHYNSRVDDFDKIVSEGYNSAYAVENNSALVFENDKFVKALSFGGSSYFLKNEDGNLTKKAL